MSIATTMHTLHTCRTLNMMQVKTHIMYTLAKCTILSGPPLTWTKWVDYTPLMTALIYIVPEEAEHCPQCLINGHSAQFMMMNRDCAVSLMRAVTRKKLPKPKSDACMSTWNPACIFQSIYELHVKWWWSFSSLKWLFFLPLGHFWNN